MTPGGGVVVTDVVRRAARRTAIGLKKDDVVLALGEIRIRTLDDLSTFLEMVQAERRRGLPASASRRGRSAGPHPASRAGRMIATLKTRPPTPRRGVP